MLTSSGWIWTNDPMVNSHLLYHWATEDTVSEKCLIFNNNFYKFSFVRNPWDWQVSYYHFILKEKDHVRHELVKSLAGFEEYLEWVISTKNPFTKGATKLQKDLITDLEGKIIVDFVGRYETLEADFDLVCKRLNIKASLPCLNKSKHRDYREYYNNRTRKLVEKHFQDDIALFGYTFDSYQSQIAAEKFFLTAAGGYWEFTKI